MGNDGYWWLAWSWHNLLFACAICNRSAKNDEFPLDPGSVVLPLNAQPPGGELPLLIDPAAEDALAHIRFLRVLHNKKERWVPVGVTPRGKETVRVLVLDRDSLLEEYCLHANQISVDVSHLAAAIAAQDPTAVQAEWSRTSAWLEPSRSFVALSRDVIEEKVSTTTLVQWGLDPVAEIRRRWETEFLRNWP